MDYPGYVLIMGEGTIVLTLLEDENHPIAVGVFPAEQLKTARYIQDYLNATRFDMEVTISDGNVPVSSAIQKP